MATIDILVVIDAQTLIANLPGGSVGQETYLGSWGTSDPYVYMIAEGSSVVSDQAKSELKVSAHSGDILRWTITSPTRGQLYNPILYSFATNNPNALTAPNMLDITLGVFSPTNLSTPTGPFTQVNYQDYVWQATLLEPGQSIQYTWCFLILDNDGKIKGAYKWDPFVTVAGQAPLAHTVASDARRQAQLAGSD